MKSKYLLLIVVLFSAFPESAFAEKVMMVDFFISNNDSVQLIDVLLVEGRTTRSMEGDYSVQLLDSSGRILDSKSIPIEFFISGIGEVDTVPVETRFSNFGGVEKLQVLHNNKVIFESPIVLCNNNKKCDNYEDYLSCPSDCPSGSDDRYCDKIKDGKCDTNCAKEVDEDCQSSLPDAGLASKQYTDPTPKSTPQPTETIPAATLPKSTSFPSAFMPLALILAVWLWRRMYWKNN